LHFTGARDDGVAVASAGPYADHLHLAPDITTPVPRHSVFACRMAFLLPNQKCKALNAYLGVQTSMSE